MVAQAGWCEYEKYNTSYDPVGWRFHCPCMDRDRPVQPLEKVAERGPYRDSENALVRGLTLQFAPVFAGFDVDLELDGQLVVDVLHGVF